MIVSAYAPVSVLVGGWSQPGIAIAFMLVGDIAGGCASRFLLSSEHSRGKNHYGANPYAEQKGTVPAE